MKAIMLGTTAFVNAVLQCSSELGKVSVVRLCGKSTTILPPFVDWPQKLRDQIEQKVYLCSGGYEYNCTDIGKIDPEELKKVALDLIEVAKNSEKKIINLVISGIFSPFKNDQEIEAKEIM